MKSIEIDSKPVKIIERQESTSNIQKDENTVENNKPLDDEIPKTNTENLKETGTGIEPEPETLTKLKEKIQTIAIDQQDSENSTLSKKGNSFMDTKDSNENSVDIDCSNQSNVEVEASVTSDRDIGLSELCPKEVLNEGTSPLLIQYGFFHKLFFKIPMVKNQ